MNKSCSGNKTCFQPSVLLAISHTFWSWGVFCCCYVFFAWWWCCFGWISATLLNHILVVVKRWQRDHTHTHTHIDFIHHPSQSHLLQIFLRQFTCSFDVALQFFHLTESDMNKGCKHFWELSVLYTANYAVSGTQCLQPNKILMLVRLAATFENNILHLCNSTSVWRIYCKILCMCEKWQRRHLCIWGPQTQHVKSMWGTFKTRTSDCLHAHLSWSNMTHLVSDCCYILLF